MNLARSLFILGFFFLGLYYPKYGQFAIADWLGFFSVILTISYYFARGRFPSLDPYIVWAGVMLIVGAGLTIPNVLNPDKSIFSAISIIYVLIIWISIGNLLFSELKYLRMAFVALSISVAVTSLYAIGQRILGFPVFGPHHFWGRMTGLTRHPNELGTFCAIVFPYSLCLVTIQSSWLAMLLWIVVPILGLIGILLSGSMTGAISLICGVIVYFFMTNHKGRIHTMLLASFGIVAISTFIVIYSNQHTHFVITRIMSFLTSNEGKFTLDQRMVANNNALIYIQQNPIQGKGYHSMVKSIGVDIDVHNTMLRAWYDGGIFTLFGILIILFGASISLLNAWRRLIESGHDAFKPYVAAASGAFVALFVSMQASPILYQRSAWFSVAVAFSVKQAVYRRSLLFN